MNMETPIVLAPPPGLKRVSHDLIGFDETKEQFEEAIAPSLRINDLLPGLNHYEPTALLLDINNLYRRADYNKFRIDYHRLKTIFDHRCDLRYCAGFSAVDRKNPDTTAWINYMYSQGYDMHVKDLKEYVDHRGNTISKGNMDMELAIEALSLSPGFGHVIIGTCDGDFVPLLKKLKEGRFRKVSVLGMTNQDRVGMNAGLIQTADYFYDLSCLKEFVELKDSKRVQRN